MAKDTIGTPGQLQKEQKPIFNPAALVTRPISDLNQNFLYLTALLGMSVRAEAL